MRRHIPQIYLLICLCYLSINSSLSAQTQSSEQTTFIDKVKVSENEIIFDFKDNFKRFHIQISGPDHFNLAEKVQNSDFFTVFSTGIGNTKFEDGLYSVEIIPDFAGSKAEQKVLRYFTETNQIEQLKAKKELMGIPSEVHNFNWSFSILNGKFVLPKNEAYGLKVNQSLPQDINSPTKNLATLRLAAEKPRTSFTNLFNAPKPQFVDIVQADDVVITFSLCVGNDCANGENFGFDTYRLKENNLRIHFDDTSDSGSFAANDWRIVANDSSNGGDNYLAFEDATAGRQVFRVDAGAPANSLRVENTGDIGIGIAAPVVEVHVVDGDSPTIRLEQNGSSGFSTQTFDIATNESNFFIRDLSNGSQLPFKILPGADSDAFVIEEDNRIGMGIKGAAKALHIRKAEPHIRLHDNDGTVQIWDIEADDSGFIILDATDTKPALTISGDQQLKLDQYIGGTFDNSSPAYTLTLDVNGNVTKSPYPTEEEDSTDADWLKTDNSAASSINDEIYTLGKVAIGGTTLEQELHVTGNIAISGSILPVSDARLKKDVSTIENGLATIQQLRPTSYLFRTETYQEMNLLEGKQYGFIAQELENVLPNLVTNSNNTDPKKAFKRVNYTGLIPFLVSSIQEQQKIIDIQQQEIDALKQKISELDALKAQVANLAKLVAGGKVDFEMTTTADKKK